MDKRTFGKVVLQGCCAPFGFTAGVIECFATILLLEMGGSFTKALKQVTAAHYTNHIRDTPLLPAALALANTNKQEPPPPKKNTKKKRFRPCKLGSPLPGAIFGRELRE